jgi:hypothetical protein
LSREKKSADRIVEAEDGSRIEFSYDAENRNQRIPGRDSTSRIWREISIRG